MSDIPRSVRITEEGPREGFQIEKGPIPTERKVEFINALAQTGLKRIQACSFVNPKRVPGWADADAVVEGIKPVEGVQFAGLWLNEQGLQRALTHKDKLYIDGKINMYPSSAFLKRNNNMTQEQYRAEVLKFIATCKANNLPVDRGSISSAFGCNFEGDISPATVVKLIGDLLELAASQDLKIRVVTLADTMAWATPLSIKRTVGAVREKFPDQALCLHLHDTRGMGIANAFAGLEMGIDRYDAAVAGLGGCPFAKHKGAAGNVCTEDLVFMCQEMGIDTGVDLDKLIECAQMAEDIVGHPLPGTVKMGGTLQALRAKAAQNLAAAA
jgi:hydroxymethylglutaryl-CoA lyase